MTSFPSEIRPDPQIRTYERAASVVFLKTKEAFGGLSNMAGGFPLAVGGVDILTAEALYQACRFPHLPDVQRLILDQASPMAAKMVGKPYRHNSRPDWDQVRVKIMRWCLRVKLAQNWVAFSELLLATDGRPIVEESYRDPFWGAKPVDGERLVGMNVLGRLLMELRDEIGSLGRDTLSRVQPLGIPDFLLQGHVIGEVSGDQASATGPEPNGSAVEVKARRRPKHSEPKADKSSLFNQLPLSEWLLPEEEG
jgi:type I restriction enzyme S subunit